jgi:hypothetical protein
MERQHNTAELDGGRLLQPITRNGGWGGGARLRWLGRLARKREASGGGAVGNLNRRREGKRGRGEVSTGVWEKKRRRGPIERDVERRRTGSGDRQLRGSGGDARRSVPRGQGRCTGRLTGGARQQCPGFNPDKLIQTRSNLFQINSNLIRSKKDLRELKFFEIKYGCEGFKKRNHFLHRDFLQIHDRN